MLIYYTKLDYIIVLLPELLQRPWLDTHLHLLNLGINNPNSTTRTSIHAHNVNTQRLIKITTH
jgi:hypothetical protein